MKTIEINNTNEIITIANSNIVETAKGDQSAGVKTLATDQLLLVSGGENSVAW